MDNATINEIVTLIVVPVILLVLGYINEKGFENLVSKPFFEKWLKPLKPWQPYLVSLTGIALSYISLKAGTPLVPDLAPYLTANGDVVTVFAGIVIAVLSMAMHKPTNPPAG